MSCLPIVLIAAFWLPADSPAPPRGVQAKPEIKTLRGKVTRLNAALKGRGLPADPEPIEKQVVLVTDDGSIHPLLSDEASRALFLDDRLRDRDAQLDVRQYAGLPYLQVLKIQVEEGGKMRVPEYYCIVCTISVRYPQICPCCQGDMELRMKPESR